MSEEYKRPDPDALLAQIKAQEEPQRGRLRIWLGSAPGVGKTHAMLQEGHRRKARGTDVVIGLVEPHGRRDIEDLIGDLEIVPPHEIVHGDTVLSEMDTDAVLARHPKVVLVDELAHINAPGSKHLKRVEDVQELLDAGITVVSTLNVQNIESQSELVQQMTGFAEPETVPDEVVDRADQIELIDLPPEAIIRRIQDGDVFPPQHAQQALAGYFTLGNLTTLRDLALRVTAREVEDKLDVYLRDRRLEGVGIGDRIMVAIDHRAIGKTLIRRGWRMAAALKGELIVVHVEPSEGRRRVQSDEQRRRLQANLQLAEDLGAEVVQLQGKVSDELIAYAHDHHVSRLVIGHPSHSRWEEILRGSVTNDILRKAPAITLHVIGDRDGSGRKDPQPTQSRPTPA